MTHLVGSAAVLERKNWHMLIFVPAYAGPSDVKVSFDMHLAHLTI